MKKAFDYLTAKPVRFFFLAALIWGGLICYLNDKDGANFAWHDLLVEANGMVFDLLVFGVLLSIYEALKEKKEKIERLHEEIDDYREWPEKEARFRIMGAVRRLIKEGEKKLNLRNCYLAGASFVDWNLSETHFDGATLEDVRFYKTTLIGASFEGANLNSTNFHSAELAGANFSNSSLLGTNFSNLNMSGVNLSGAKIMVTIHFLGDISNGKSSCDWWFDELEKKGVKGLEQIRNKYFVDDFGTLQLK